MSNTKNARINVVAKILNLSGEDPRAAVVFQPGTLRTHDHGKKRVGLPRSYGPHDGRDSTSTYIQVKSNKYKQATQQKSIGSGQRKHCNLMIFSRRPQQAVAGVGIASCPVIEIEYDTI